MVDVEALFELWSICKEYIPAKERIAAADHVVNDLMNAIGDAELKEFCKRDHHLSEAFRSLGLEEDNYEDDDEELEF